MDISKDSFVNIFEQAKNQMGQVLQAIQNAEGNDKQNDVELVKTAIDRMNEELERINAYWFFNDESINEQFKNYSERRIDNILSICHQFRSRLSTQRYYTNCVGFASEFCNVIGDKASNELFSNFRYGNCNYILFGKNGAGKTTLINELAKSMFDSGSYVIPATRNIGYSPNMGYNDSEVRLDNALTVNNGRSLFLLTKEIIKKEIEYGRLTEKSGNSMNVIVENAFNSLGLNRKLKIAANGELTLTLDDGTEEYSFSRASDGEKSAFFFISVVLLAPKDSYLIIDEPENHLNGSLMVKLFDLLESERKDITFVYATHNLHFIESRDETELIYLKKTNEHGKWEFNKFEDYDELPLDTILTIEGTNDDVIFCEGESFDSLDCKLYRAIYPNYQVVPSKGCENVISKTYVFNENETTFRKKAFGIVDNDFRKEEDIENLKERKIYVSKLNEIENFFLLEPFLLKAKEQFLIEDSVEEIKNKIVDLVNSKKDEILRDYATKSIRRINLKNQLRDINNVENSIDILNNENKTLFLTEFNNFKAQFENAISNREYEKLMVLVPGKKIYRDIISRFFNNNHCEPYINLCLKVVCQDNDVRNYLKQYISPDLN